MNWIPYYKQYLVENFPALLRSIPWNYKNDLTLAGADILWQTTGNPVFLQAILDAAPYLLSPKGVIQNYSDREYNLDKISFGKSLLLLFKHTGEEMYKQAALRCYHHLGTYPRTRAGVFFHKDIYPYQAWLDGQYMALPFYAACEVLTGTLRFDDIVDQLETVRQNLYVPETRLYAHGWDESKAARWADPQTGLSPSFWLRAVGWHLMALCDVYEIIHPYARRRESVASLLQEAVEGLMPYQESSSGMYLQLVDRADLPDNYPETSGNAMVAYALMKGSRLGILPDSCALHGKEILESIRTIYLKESSEGYRLYGICASAGLGPGPDNRTDRDGSSTYYLSEAQIPDNQHGTGACMLAYGEAMRTSKS